MNIDMWGQEIAGNAESGAAWDAAWQRFTHFRGDPIDALAGANESDDEFVMGSVFAATYMVLGGVPFDGSELVTHFERAGSRVPAAGDREAAHVAAIEHLMAGNFTLAAKQWDELARAEPDFAAVRFAHDVYLHVGDANGRLASSRAAIKQWNQGPGANFIASQYAFALEEVGQYAEAEDIALRALEFDPDDLWARHALAHVYESTDDTEAALKLLVGSADRWNEQDQLATHIWWHLALRLLAKGDITAVLGIFDERLSDATSPYRLCDLTSLLWRSELAGFDVGRRWDAVADRWDTMAERHTAGFVDVHALLTYARRSDHAGAARWRDGLAKRASGTSENDRIFQDVVVPLVTAMDNYADGNPGEFLSIHDRLGPEIHRIGGSLAQRDLIALTHQAAAAAV